MKRFLRALPQKYQEDIQREELRKAELERTMAGWKDAPADAEKRLDALTLAFMNKLLHQPTTVLKKAGQGNRTDLYLDALHVLFDLELDSDEEPSQDLDA